MPGLFLSLAFLSAFTSTESVRVVTLGELMKGVVKCTNEERIHLGVPAVLENDRLVLIAQEMAENMAASSTLSHTDSRGRDLSRRVDDGGYAWSTIAENIAYGYGSPEAVVKGWIKSPGHYQNLKNKDYSEIGVGISRSAKGQIFWVQIFGHPR